MDTSRVWQGCTSRRPGIRRLLGAVTLTIASALAMTGCTLITELSGTEDAEVPVVETPKAAPAETGAESKKFETDEAADPVGEAEPRGDADAMNPQRDLPEEATEPLFVGQVVLGEAVDHDLPVISTGEDAVAAAEALVEFSAETSGFAKIIVAGADAGQSVVIVTIDDCAESDPELSNTGETLTLLTSPADGPDCNGPVTAVAIFVVDPETVPGDYDLDACQTGEVIALVDGRPADGEAAAYCADDGP